MAIKIMSFSDWVNEYRPVQFDDDTELLYNVDTVIEGKRDLLIKKAMDLIGKYRTTYPDYLTENIYPDDHINMVFIEDGRNPANNIPFGYVVTRKPMLPMFNIDKIIIELDARHKITILKSLKDL